MIGKCDKCGKRRTIYLVKAYGKTQHLCGKCIAESREELYKQKAIITII